MSSPTTSKIFIDNLTALHKAREAYVASKSSKKIRSALNHNVRASGDIKYITGDIFTLNLKVFTLNVSVKDDGEVLEKVWTKIDNKSYLNVGAVM